MRALRGAALAVVACLGLSSCIGSVDRAVFNDEIRARGGGVTSAALDEAIQAIAAETAGLLVLRQVDVNPIDATVVAEVQDPNAPDVVDRYLVKDGTVRDVTPVRLSVRDEPRAFFGRDVPVGDIERIIDGALDAFGEPNAWVERYQIMPDPVDDQVLRVMVQVSSNRAYGVVVTDARGTAYEVARQ